MTGSVRIRPGDDRIFFESQSHPNTLLTGFNELWQNGHLLDVTLCAEGQSFLAHRAVLASCSDYFRAMFTDAMRESKQSKITLNGVTARGIDLLLTYAYTSKLELNLCNIQDVLSAASYIQMDAVVEACSNFLQTQLDTVNCVDIVTISETYSLEKLTQKCYRFICAHLSSFSNTSEIHRFSWNQLENILSCDYPVDCSEAAVLKIVLQWINTKQADIKITHRLLHKVRLFEISPNDLERTLLQSGHSCDSQIFNSTQSLTISQKCLERLQQATLTFPSTNSNALINSRGMELALVKVGGFRTAGITNEVTYFSSSTKKWHHLTTIPHVEQCNYGTEVYDNELFVVGGCYNVCLKEYIHPFGFKFNPMANKWITIAPMKQDRCRFSLNFVGKYLYAIGGASEFDETDDRTHELNCERYCPTNDLWEYIAAIPEDCAQHAGASYNNCLYISGGLERNNVLSTFWKFDPDSNIWQLLPPMLTPRADHVMLTINNNLYVCGGWLEETHAENRRLVETIDLYNVDTKTWEVVTSIPTPKFHAGIVAVESKIYIIGGFYSDSWFDKASSTVECYDIHKKEWTTLDKYPQNIWECACVSLHIPKCRDDMEIIIDESNNYDESSDR